MDTTTEPADPAAASRSGTAGGCHRYAGTAATVITAVALFAGAVVPVATQGTTRSLADAVPVIVRELPGAGQVPERAVAAFGGEIERRLGLIGGFSASLPGDRVAALRATAGVSSVTPDAELTLSDADVEAQADQSGSLSTIAGPITGASALHARGVTGEGVDVALIDSGVAPVDGLRSAGKIVHGPDLTSDAGTAARNLDGYGHGTSMAGVIAGKDSPLSGPVSGNRSDFVGIAPDSRIVSIKIADALGQTDVSQAIAAIDWVVENGRRDGLNVRVLNLSFNTDGVQSYRLDPLAFAVEMAWQRGVVVVVAAGNGGNDTSRLANPATDPYVIAVGSDGSGGTATTADDVVSSFSNSGDGTRNPDVLAPGEQVVSLRVPGSYLDATYPGARLGTRLFRGSGTSHAAAVVSGAAALLLSDRPKLRPDQVKALLTGTARPIPSAPATLQGRGLIDVRAAADMPTPDTAQTWPRATGKGSLQLARGSMGVTVDGKDVQGEVDVRGHSFDSAAWANGLQGNANWSGTSWRGLDWSGMSGAGMSWSTTSDSGTGWSGMASAGMSWSGMSWSGMSWSGMSWSGMSWSGTTWSTAAWS